MEQDFIEYANSNLASLMEEQGNAYLFQLVYASLSIIGSTEIRNEHSVIYSFVSTVTISDTTISDFTMDDITIRGVSSNITLSNLNFSNFTTSGNANFLVDTLDSHLIIQSSTSVIFRARSSQLDIQGITYGTISGVNELAVISNCIDSTITGIESTQTDITGENLIRIEKSDKISLSDIMLRNTQAQALSIVDSNIHSISRFDMANCSQGIYIEGSQIHSLDESTFQNNGGSQKLNGGAIHMMNSEIMLSNSIFSENLAQDGGAISFQCSSLDI